jgi:hypothetical protein
MSITYRNIFGYNPDVAVSSTENLSTADSMIISLGGTTLRIKAGGNAGDDVAGAGAQQITLVGLDASGNLQSSVIDTAGTSASSSTSESYERLLSIKVTRAGTAFASQSAAITIETTGGVTIGQMTNGDAKQFQYTVPLGKRAFIRSLTFSSSTACIFQLTSFMSSFDSTPAKNQPIHTYVGAGSSVSYSFNDGEYELAPLQLISCECQNTDGSNTADASALMTIVEYGE